MPNTILFDLDGTLIDSRADIACAVNLTRRDFGLAPKTEAEVVACVGEGVRALIERVSPERPEIWDAMLERQREHYRTHCLDRTTLYPGVARALSVLCDAGWRLGVVTNKPGAVSRHILEGLGASAWFGAVVGGGDTPELKPEPGPLHAAAARLGCVLDATDWMVGDHVTDLEAGARAGVRRCFCSYGFGERRGASCEAVVSAPEEWSVRCGRPGV